MFALKGKEVYWVGATMRLTRREILEQLGRLGIQEISDLKRSCREFELYLNCARYRL
jgi:hypothetical protein